MPRLLPKELVDSGGNLSWCGRSVPWSRSSPTRLSAWEPCVPLLHIEPRAEAIGLDGKPRVMPPSLALQWHGPTAQVALHFPMSVARELVNRGETLSNSIVGEALIDTGSSSSCIDIEAA